jgi:DtxR family Mn-dependent transcriptional regulator
LEDHIADFLGNPTEDPHGDPIPTKAGSIVASDQQSLADLEPGARATIRRIGAQDPERLRYLRGLGLIPKASVSMIDHAPFQGPVRVRVANGDEHSLDRSLAQQIWVSTPRQALARKRLGKTRRAVRH